MKNQETSVARDQAGAALARNVLLNEDVHAGGVYHVVARGPVEERRAEYVQLRDQIAGFGRLKSALMPGRLATLQARLAAIPTEEKWRDSIVNAVCTEGRNANLTHFLKGSTYTATAFLGLIESTGYGFAGADGSGVAATNLAASITAAGGGSPANGWNEAPSSVFATRGTPSFGSASAGALALSTPVACSILAARTIKGCFVIVRSAAGTASTSTVGNTNGALWSAGLFTGGDKPVDNGDTLNVSYTSTLT